MNKLRVALLILLITPFLNAQEPVSCPSGLARFQAGDYSAAQDLLWKCVESMAGNSNHAFYLALTYRSLKNYATGLIRVNEDLKQYPDNVDLLYIAAYLHYRRNDTKESMILTSRAYTVAPKDWRIHQLFALNYISFNMLEAAKLSLKQAIALNPNNAELQYQLARLYFTLGSFVDSIEISKKALAITPDYPEVYYNLALSYEGSGNVELATQSFQKAIELDRKYNKRDEWPLVDFAVYQRMGGNPEASISLLKEALTINPDSPKANYEMGELLRDMRRYDEARKYLETALKLDPCNARTIYSLAIVTRQLGDTTKSASLFKQFQEVDRETKDPVTSGPVNEGAVHGGLVNDGAVNDRRTCPAASQPAP
jgi:tetratricopeptide (TPR) repeat protein